VIPADARKLFNISAGDKLVVLGDENQGIAVLKSDMFLALADAVRGIEP
jgi:AbrB family looped-hinge helix DNA binding protein